MVCVARYAALMAMPPQCLRHLCNKLCTMFSMHACQLSPAAPSNAHTWLMLHGVHALGACSMHACLIPAMGHELGPRHVLDFARLCRSGRIHRFKVKRLFCCHRAHGVLVVAAVVAVIVSNIVNQLGNVARDNGLDLLRRWRVLAVLRAGWQEVDVIGRGACAGHKPRRAQSHIVQASHHAAESLLDGRHGAPRGWEWLALTAGSR
mmetsp:Transcript_2571/g.6862  ORF Transcript_2571/g.6862 Transcript_2571/m.6862 type:complete len:206 (-) Transcript_2571:35-652(-)